MAIVDLVMPKLGESIMEATILKWHKSAGDQVKMDETVLDIATDKVDSEVPSTTDGTIQELLFKENEVVPVGAVIAKINTNSADNDTHHQEQSPEAQMTQVPKQQQDPLPNIPVQQYRPSPGSNRFYSPLVLTIAGSEGISMQELETIPGSGHEGRVTKRDIMQYVSDRGTSSANGHNRQKQQYAEIAVVEAAAETVAKQETSPNPYMNPASYNGNVEIVELDRMRKMIAKHMSDSKDISAHVTSFSEADVTNLVLWRERIKKPFEKRENEKITFTPLFIEMVIRCLKRYPWLNSSIDGDKLLIKKDINIGMATALPNGNLIVPVIKNADQLNLVGLTRQVNRLANDARINKLKPDDTAAGTFTLTNVGTFGSIMGTPIINQPQVAILAVGAIKKRPVVIETAQGDSIAIRHMMYLSLSYDHRIIDGALGSTFLNAITKEFENFDPEREY